MHIFIHEFTGSFREPVAQARVKANDLMHIFIHEFTCAQPDSALSKNLRVEGEAMLSAIVDDMSRIEGVRLTTIRNGQALDARSGTVCGHCPTSMEALFRQLARSADFTLVIAPECDDILRTLCAWVEEEGGRLLGPSFEAVRLTGDKLALGRHLLDHGIATPPCAPYLPETRVPDAWFPLVRKPRDGAGSQATFLLRNLGDLQDCEEQARLEGWQGEAIVQPYIEGLSVSLAFLVGPSVRMPLLPASQDLSTDGRFHYRGGSLPLSTELCPRVVRLADRAVASVPGLKGYVGVDMVLGKEKDGSKDYVIEINPRLTTSYVGLRALARVNLAEAMIKAAQGEPLPALSWNAGQVRFQANGTLQFTTSAAGMNTMA